MIKDLKLRCKVVEKDTVMFSSGTKNIEIEVIWLEQKLTPNVLISKHQAKMLQNWLDKAIEEMS